MKMLKILDYKLLLPNKPISDYLYCYALVDEPGFFEGFIYLVL